ncbi:hypothetical protein HRbin08_00694 [bacterium HR08]|nr:hypothetical protein HRbin08_00694 [bacterium HR08]
MRHAAFALALLSALASGAPAQNAPMTLAELVQSAGAIVAGRIVEVREERHPQYPSLILTRVTLAVERTFKGENKQRASSGRFTFFQIGGSRRLRSFHLPRYHEGEDVVLFLYPESAYGLTSPVGGAAGKFRLFVDPQTKRRLVANGFENLELLSDLPRTSIIVAERALAARHERGPIEYDTFAALITSLVNARH